MNTLYLFRNFILILCFGIFLSSCADGSLEGEPEDVNQSLLIDFVEQQLIFTSDISEKLGSQKNINLNANTTSASPIHYNYESLSNELQMANVEDFDLVAKMFIVMQKKVNGFLEELTTSNVSVTEESIVNTISDEITRQMAERIDVLRANKDCGIGLNDARFSCETDYAISLAEKTVSNFFVNGPDSFIGIIKTGTLYVECGSEAMAVFRSCESI